MSGFGLVAHVVFLVGETRVCVLIDGAGSHLSGGQCIVPPIVSFWLSMVLVWLCTACLLMFSFVFLYFAHVGRLCLQVSLQCLIPTLI